MSSRRKQFKPKSAIDVAEAAMAVAATAAAAAAAVSAMTGATKLDDEPDKMNNSSFNTSLVYTHEASDAIESNERKRKRSDAEEDGDEDDEEHSETNNDTMNDIDDNMVDEYELSEIQYDDPRLNQTTANAFDSSYLDQSQLSQSQLGNSTMLLMFKCKVCGKAFKHRRSLNRHVKLHSGEKNFKCPFCTTAFARSDHLKAHIRTHNNSKPYRCSICQCGYSTQAALKVHIAHHHSKSKFKCVLCNDLEFHSQLALEGHMYTKHSKENENADLNELINETATINPTLVSVDETQRSKLTEINNLINKNENDNFFDHHHHHHNHHHQIDQQTINLSISPNKNSNLIKIAPKLINNMNNINNNNNNINNNMNNNNNVNSNNNSNSYCELCNARFSNVESYLVHMRNCHNSPVKQSASVVVKEEFYDLNYTKEIQYQCTQCNLSLMKLNDYLQHIKKEHCVEVYRCVLCKQMQLFDNLNLLKEHFFVAHQSNKLETFKCKLCAHTTITIDDLSAHLKNSHGQSLNITSSTAQQQQQQQHSPYNSQHNGNHSLNHSNQYSCQYCRNTFTNKAQLERHIRIHLSTIDLKCNICDKQFENEIQLNQHKLTHSLNGANICTPVQPKSSIAGSPQCAFCKSTIENELQFKDHFKRHNNIGQPNQTPQNGKMSYSCIICRALLTSNNEYLTHMKSHLANIINKKLIDNNNQQNHNLMVKCPKCPLKFENNQELDLHFKKFHPVDSIVQTSSCPLSPATTTSSSSSTSSIQGIKNEANSMARMTSNQIFLCEICSSKFDSNFKLQTHLILKHEYGNQANATFTCPVCDESYNRADLLLQHTQIHGQAAKIYKCTICPLAFVFKSQLINHSFSHQAHSQSKNSILHQQLTKPIVSDIKTNITNVVSMNPYRHIQQSDPLQTQQQHLQLQQQQQQQQSQYIVHTNPNGTKTYSCLTCSKTFANQRNLNIHIRIHTGFRPFECDICQRKFTRRENLRSHMKCHLNLRPFTCSICNRSFRRKSHVTSHIEVHFKSKVNNCIECNQQFEQLDSFLSHLIGDHTIYDKELLQLIKTKQIIDLSKFSNINYEQIINQPSGSPASMSLSSKPCPQQPAAYNAIQPIQHYQNSVKNEMTTASQAIIEEENFDDEEEEQSPYTDGDYGGEESGLVIEDEIPEDEVNEDYGEDVNSVNMNGDNSQEGADEDEYNNIEDNDYCDNEEENGLVNEEDINEDEIDYTD